MAQLTFEQLHQVLADSLSPSAETRKNAEHQLQAAQKVSGHPLDLLRLVASSDVPSAPVRQAAAVRLKNVVKHGWDPDREGGTNGIVISAEDRATIKSHLVQLMCTVPPQIQSQCSETISLIAAVDYPKEWENLMPELVQQFNSPDMAVVCGVLQTADSIFKMFRYVNRTDGLYKILGYTLDIIQAPLLTLFQTVGQAIQQMPTNVAELRPRFEALRLICRIVWSLNYQDLPEFFEDHMQEWMSEFARYLQYRNHLLEDESEETQAGPVERLQAAIIPILFLYADKDEEVFIPMLPDFARLVWNLLMNVSPYPKHDNLATTSIKFLSLLIEKPMHSALFQDEATLRQIVARIVLPNIAIREEDQEKFEDDPKEFIMLEMDGSDSESRRRCSQKLLQAMCRYFEKQTTTICLEHIGIMINEFAADPNNKWTSKDIAIHLFCGVAIRRESQREGVSEVNDAVNLMEFFNNYILPELQDVDHSSRPIVKASSLKFVATFRNQFAKEQLVALLPLLIFHLGSSYVVVHSFAAYGIERFLVTKDTTNLSVGVPQKTKVGRAEIQPHLEPLFTGLFSIMDRDDENDWVIKCVMRCLQVSNEDLVPVTNIVLDKLTGAVVRISKNPRNPEYNHYIFESIAVLIRALCSRDPHLTASFEEHLFPPFQDVLQRDVLELSPYVFQIFAQILEYRPREAGLGPAYTTMFSPFMSAFLWERNGNVPALTRLMNAYLDRDAASLVAAGHLLGILGIFQKVYSMAGLYNYALEILGAIITHVSPETVQPHMATIFSILLQRLQANQNQNWRFVKSLTHFFCLYIGKYGTTSFIEALDRASTGKAFLIIDKVWIPSLLQDPPRRLEAKAQVVGLTKLMCETPAMLTDEAGRNVWANILTAILTIFTKTDDVNFGSLDAFDSTEDVQVGYDAQYSQLSFAKKQVRDPFPDVDAQIMFVQGLHSLSTSHPGVLGPLAHAALQSDVKLAAGLEQMLKSAGIILL